MKFSTIKGSGEYKSECGMFSIVKSGGTFTLFNANGEALFTGKFGECKGQASDVASHYRETVTVCKNDATVEEATEPAPLKKARKGRGSRGKKAIVIPESTPETAVEETAPESTPETAPVVESAPAPESTPETTPVVESHNLDWQEGESEDGESHRITRWMEDRGDYLVGMLDYADRREFVAYRAHPVKGTISLPIEVDDKMRGKRYGSAEAAFNACVDHARGVYGEVVSNHDVRIAQIPPRGVKMDKGSSKKDEVCCKDHPLCSCLSAKKRSSAGKKNGAIHGSEDKWGDTHLAHKIVNATLAGSEGLVDMKTISAAVAAAGYVKANGKANTYYVHINGLRERGLISKQGSGYVVTTKGKDLWTA